MKRIFKLDSRKEVENEKMRKKVVIICAHPQPSFTFLHSPFPAPTPLLEPLDVKSPVFQHEELLSHFRHNLADSAIADAITFHEYSRVHNPKLKAKVSRKMGWGKPSFVFQLGEIILLMESAISNMHFLFASFR